MAQSEFDIDDEKFELTYGAFEIRKVGSRRWLRNAWRAELRNDDDPADLNSQELREWGREQAGAYSEDQRDPERESAADRTPAERDAFRNVIAEATASEARRAVFAVDPMTQKRSVVHRMHQVDLTAPDLLSLPATIDTLRSTLLGGALLADDELTVDRWLRKRSATKAERRAEFLPLLPIWEGVANSAPIFVGTKLLPLAGAAAEYAEAFGWTVPATIRWILTGSTPSICFDLDRPIAGDNARPRTVAAMAIGPNHDVGLPGDVTGRGHGRICGRTRPRHGPRRRSRGVLPAPHLRRGGRKSGPGGQPATVCLVKKRGGRFCGRKAAAERGGTGRLRGVKSPASRSTCV